MENILTQYDRSCSKPSDINEHLPVLKKYAEECDVVIEMGVRSIVSTWAFLAAKPKKLISIDIVHPNDYINHDPNGCNIKLVEELSLNNNIDFEFILGDTLKIDPINCDLLFLDTLHDYNQVKGEIERHSSSCNKYIIFHDTTHFAEKGETPGEGGIWPAIEEFLQNNDEWSLHERLYNNNGLTIIKRNK